MTKHKAGTIFEREYKGKKVKVAVKKDGQYYYNGKPYRSLSAAVAKITGTKTPATVFFKVKSSKKVAKRGRKEKPAIAEANGTFSVTSVIEQAVAKAVAEINIAGLVQREVRNLFRTESAED